MTTLLLDIGNSRCKWGLWEQGRITETGALAHEIVDDPVRWAFARGVERAIACNVAGEGLGIRVGKAIRETADVGLELAVTAAEHAGVRCGYAQPDRLGVDRWMAVLAASRETTTPCLVVDAGTAMTIDALASPEQHLGGYIIPGLAMMQRALTRRTANIRVDESTPPAEQFGDSTSEAVRNGALTALIGSIERAAMQLARDTDLQVGPMTILFTGGDGLLLAQKLSRESSYRANLVLDGLAIYAELAE